MRVLVTNDDGIHSKGLDVLVKAIKKKAAEVIVVVPDQERSAVSHSMTLHKPLRVEEIEKNIFLINGTPADCVRFGILEFAKNQDIDLVVSGINRGANLGEDVLYSGTVGAAIEGTILGVRSMAVSLVTNGNSYYDTAAEFSCQIMDKVIEYGLEEGVYLNINVPDLPLHSIKGLAVTRQGTRIYGKTIDKRKDPRGSFYYWIAGEVVSGFKEEGTDVKVVDESLVSISPLRIDVTSYDSLEKIKKWKF